MSGRNLHDLESLLLSVRDPESKRLAQEAITAYQAGAYRAAILSIWVAVCADIISKLRELANGGDGAAQSQITDLQGWIENDQIRHLQNFENNLVVLAEEQFEMLLPHEARDLARLQEDRHLCAHPAYVSDEVLFNPTPEVTRTHICHAILHLLSCQPVQGNSLIARYDRDLLGGSLPKKPEDIQIALKENYLNRVKPGAITSFMKALAKSLLCSESGNYAGREFEISHTLAAIGKIAPSPYEEIVPKLFKSLATEIEAEKVLNICHYIEADPRIWDWLGEGGQGRILALIDNNKILDALPAFRATGITKIADKILPKLNSGDETLTGQILSKYPCEAFVEKALDCYLHSYSFADAEKNGQTILVPHAQYFKTHDIQALAALMRQNRNDQILFASKSAKVLIQVFYQTGHLLPEANEHWEDIAEYIVERRVDDSYDYPQLLGELEQAGIDVPKRTEN